MSAHLSGDPELPAERMDSMGVAEQEEFGGGLLGGGHATADDLDGQPAAAPDTLPPAPAPPSEPAPHSAAPPGLDPGSAPAAAEAGEAHGGDGVGHHAAQPDAGGEAHAASRSPSASPREGGPCTKEESDDGLGKRKRGRAPDRSLDKGTRPTRGRADADREAGDPQELDGEGGGPEDLIGDGFVGQLGTAYTPGRDNGEDGGGRVTRKRRRNTGNTSWMEERQSFAGQGSKPERILRKIGTSYGSGFTKLPADGAAEGETFEFYANKHEFVEMASTTVAESYRPRPLALNSEKTKRLTQAEIDRDRNPDFWTWSCNEEFLGTGGEYKEAWGPRPKKNDKKFPKQVKQILKRAGIAPGGASRTWEHIKDIPGDNWRLRLSRTEENATVFDELFPGPGSAQATFSEMAPEEHQAAQYLLELMRGPGKKGAKRGKDGGPLMPGELGVDAEALVLAGNTLAREAKAEEDAEAEAQAQAAAAAAAMAMAEVQAQASSSSAVLSTEAPAPLAEGQEELAPGGGGAPAHVMSEGAHVSEGAPVGEDAPMGEGGPVGEGAQVGEGAPLDGGGGVGEGAPEGEGVPEAGGKV